MPKVAGHVSPKGPSGAKEPLIIGLFCPKGAFRRNMTYEDKAPYASTPACSLYAAGRILARDRVGGGGLHHLVSPHILSVPLPAF